MALRTVGVRLVAEVADYTRNMKQAGQTAKSFAGELGHAAKAGKLDAVADQAAGAGLALAGLAGTAVKLSMDFEKSMSAVSAATHASAGDMEQLRKAAIAAGKDTQYSATEAADAITELSKAGVKTADVLNGGLDGALDLAAAGQLDVAEAAETAASAMTQFKLSGNQVPHIADLLAAAAGKAQGSVHDMGYALNQSGLVASQFGLSIEDTTGVLAQFANAGLLGSDAGTSFKTMLLAIANPSGVTSRKMQELGISFYDAQGSFIGLSGVADELRDKLGQLSEEQRNAAMGQIFGSDAIRAATILYRDGSKGVEEWKNKVNDAGYASETAAKLTDNLAGDIERLKGSLETMAIEAGGGANGGLRIVVKSLEALVDQFGRLPSVVSSGVTVLGLLGGATLLAAAGWIKVRRSTADALAELRNAGPAGARAAGSLERVGKYAGRAAAAFVALEIAAAAINSMQDELNPQLEALGQGLVKWSEGADLSGEAARVLGADMDDLKDKFKFLADEDNNRRMAVKNLQGGLESLVPGLDGTSESLAKTKERIESMDSALATLVQGGSTAQANAVFQKLTEQLAVEGVTVDEVKKQFPAYAAAVETAGSASASTSESVKGLGEAAESSSGQIMALSKSIDDLFQEQMSADRAALKLADSTQTLTAELTKGKRVLELDSEEGRKNRAVVVDQLDAIEAVRDARVRGGATIEEANKLYQKDIDGLRKIMRQAGFTEASIDGLVGAYEDIPGKVATSISTPGLPQVREGIAGYDKQLGDLARRVKTEVSVEGKEKAYKALTELLILQQAAKKGISISAATSAFNKNAKGFRAGGRTGSMGEHEPAGIVHGQEVVLNARTVRNVDRQEPGFLDEVLATGGLPGYRGGGRVLSVPFPVNAAGTKIPSRAEALGAVGGIAGGSFGKWPSSPAAQRGDSGVWHQILALVKASGIPYEFGNSYRAGDPKWHGSGRAIDFMGYNQDRLAQFFMARKPSVLELIHRTKSHDYGVTRGHNAPMPHQWPLHRNHLHVAMEDGGTITEPIYGVGASGRTYSFGEGYKPERVVPNWQSSGGGGTATITVQVINQGVIGSKVEAENFLVGAIDKLKRRGRI